MLSVKPLGSVLMEPTRYKVSDVRTWGEQHVLGFRADFFNLFNIASYGNPDNGIADRNFGQISNVRSRVRQIQLSLHYAF